MEPKEKKILITGGHLTTAHITGKELQSQGFTNIVWVGRKFTQSGDTSTSPEFQLVSHLEIPFIHFTTGKLWRKWNKFTYKTAFKDLLFIPYGFIKALRIIKNEKPDLILSFGGYVALPIVVAAKVMKKKIITHEQVIVPGLATKIIARFANKILLSWDQSEKYFSKYKDKIVITGNPSWVQHNKEKEETIHFENNLPIVTIIGGNQGAKAINRAIFADLESILKFANVIHQTGRSEVTQDKYKASEIKSSLSETLSERYMFSPYLIENVHEVFEKSDLIVARGGANTMTDLILKSKKCIIIPIPWSSGGEQKINAEFMKEIGLASIIEYEKEINPEELLKEIKSRLKEPFEPNKSAIKDLQLRIRYAHKKIFKEIADLLV